MLKLYNGYKNDYKKTYFLYTIPLLHILVKQKWEEYIYLNLKTKNGFQLF